MDRKLVVSNIKQILLLAIFVWVIFFISFNEISSIKSYEYTIFRGVMNPLRTKINIFVVFIRYMISLFGMFVILFYILTVTDEKPSVIEQIQNFASFVVCF